MTIQYKAIISSIAIATTLALAPGTVSAKQAPSSEAADKQDGIFTKEDRRIIEDFFDLLGGQESDSDKHKGKSHKKGKSDGLPPGLAKRDELPPGLQKQLVKNGQLPPGLQKRSLPTNLEHRLSTLPKDLERVIVGEDILLIQRGVGLILDIIKGGAK